ncbi:MAG TPA: HDOD domain-containing protein [Deltaproteobacteria bacterium]|nr:HDOD domain-containing protein [Deltaproteobacteria bacterium]HQB38747.1 HDOD domain-containing protein [Deltaproteobacteria bacterium]
MPRSRPDLETIIDNASTVYSLPLIHDRLTQAINNPRASFADITEIISEDQGLCFRILKLANSPMFGYHRNIDTITRAATIIGTQQLRDLSLAVSVIGVFKGIPEELINMTSFWQHSITCGIVARALATCRREPNVERFFVAGMLHDVGQLVLFTSMPRIMCDIIEENRSSGQPQYLVQQDLLGFDHADVGGELLKKWKIPQSVAEPVARHHAPGLSTVHPVGASLLHVADLITHAMQAGFSGESHVPPLDADAWERLDIPVSMLSTIITQADSQMHEIIDTVFGSSLS